MIRMKCNARLKSTANTHSVIMHQRAARACRLAFEAVLLHRHTMMHKPPCLANYTLTHKAEYTLTACNVNSQVCQPLAANGQVMIAVAAPRSPGHHQ